MPNSFIHAKVFIREGYPNRETGKKGDPRLQFNNIQLLHDVMESYAKKLTIQLNIDELQEDKINVLQDIFSSHKGDNKLNFVVYEMKDRIKLHMPSRKQKVRISQELLDALEEQQVLYKLN